MPIPKPELDRVGKLLVEYSERRVPPHARAEVYLDTLVCGDAIALVERRPYFRDRSRSAASNIARFVYDRNRATWRLECRDGQGRWHPYPYLEATRRFEELLKEIDADPTGIFWG